MQIGERIIGLIKERGMTQKEFSKRTGIGQATISDWKHKKHNPGADKLPIICQTLGITMDELMDSETVLPPHATDYYQIPKDSDLAQIIELYQSIDPTTQKRLLAYLTLLKQ